MRSTDSIFSGKQSFLGSWLGVGHVTWPRSDPILGCTSCVWQGVCVGVVVGGVPVVPAAHMGQEGLRAQ